MLKKPPKKKKDQVFGKKGPTARIGVENETLIVMTFPGETRGP